ncbi:MAG: DUF4157 domain-containing protein [Rhizobiales bacterium]|nr:DUF4157 domain-containing protein [Hyphomicrobiales bacterium]
MASAHQIVRARLRDALDGDARVALAPSLLAEFERRFEARLGDIPIHTGARVDALCRDVGARACAVDGAILIARAEWRPEAPAFRELLAHELCHALQQRARRVEKTALVPVGAADDAMEREAERIADEAMGGRRRSAVTPDASGALRRVLMVEAASAKLTVDVKGSTPGVDLHPGGRLCVLHLTRGAAEILNPSASVTARSASAINVAGRVRATQDNIDDLPGDLLGRRFRMRQLTRLRTLRALYAGATSADGALEYDIAKPPLAPDAFFLSWCSDAVKSAAPYMNTRAELVMVEPGGAFTIENDTDDHPNASFGLAFIQPNTKTGSHNILFEASRDQEFVTALVEVDRRNVATTLAHVFWRASWLVRCSWKGPAPGSGGPPVCTPKLVKGTLEVDKFELGAPDDPEVAKLLTDLDPDYAKTANSWMRAASKQAETSGAGVNFMTAWPKSVPAKFFTP